MAHMTLVGGGSVLRGFARRLVSECVRSDVNAYEYAAVCARDRERARTRREHARKWDRDVGVGGDGGVGVGGGGAEEADEWGVKKTRIRVFAARDRVVSAWKGGSVLCEMEEFGEEMWMRKQEFEEHGKNIVYR